MHCERRLKRSIAMGLFSWLSCWTRRYTPRSFLSRFPKVRGGNETLLYSWQYIFLLPKVEFRYAPWTWLPSKTIGLQVELQPYIYNELMKQSLKTQRYWTNSICRPCQMPQTNARFLANLFSERSKYSPFTWGYVANWSLAAARLYSITSVAFQERGYRFCSDAQAVKPKAIPSRSTDIRQLDMSCFAVVSKPSFISFKDKTRFLRGRGHWRSRYEETFFLCSRVFIGESGA